MTITISEKQDDVSVEALTGEMFFLSLLGKAFITYPDQKSRDWYCSLLDKTLFVDIPFAGEQPRVREGVTVLCDWIEKNQGVDPDDILLDMQTDNTRLFHCAQNILAPPWESVYRTKERLVLQEHTLRVRRFYNKFGLALSGKYMEPDDHIGLELLFVAYLTRKALLALSEEDPKTCGAFMDARRAFLADHLLQWSLLFCRQLEQHARNGFYKGMGLLLNGISRELAAMHAIDLCAIDAVCASA